MKEHVMDFLKNTYLNPNYHVAIKGRNLCNLTPEEIQIIERTIK